MFAERNVHRRSRLSVALFLMLQTLGVSPVLAVNLKGDVASVDGTPLCALALASGKSMFTCSPAGPFSLTELPQEADGSVVLQVYASGFFPSVTRLTEFGYQSVVLQPARQCPVEQPATNKQLTEKMLGTWHFEYTIITTFDETYQFSEPAEPSTTSPGEWVLIGTDENGNAVLTNYNTEFRKHGLLAESILFDKFYVFDFVSNDAISGCYYQVDKDTLDFSSCYPLEGARTSSIQSLEIESAGESAGELRSRDSRLLKEIEAHRLAQESLGVATLGVQDPAIEAARQMYSSAMQARKAAD